MSNLSSSSSSFDKAAIATAVREFQVQRQEMNGAFLERKEEINLLQVSLIAEQPLVLLGLAGVGKSAMVNAFAGSLEQPKQAEVVNYWQYLLGKYDTKADLFGITSVKELRENDRYVINPAGKMPQARVAFLDEVFKGNPATLNSMLTIINEKQFDDGTGVRKDVPLEMLVGASNEMPEEGEGLEALWDRFVLRHVVQDIEKDESFISLLTGEGIGKVSCTVSRAAVLALRSLAKQVDISPAIPALLKIREALQGQSIRVSARTWRKASDILKAVAALKGRSSVANSDLSILNSVLWDSQDQIDAIRKLLAEFASDDSKIAMSICDAAREIVNKLKAHDPKELTLSQLSTAKRALANLSQQLKSLDSEDDGVCEAAEHMSSFKADIKRLTLAASGA